MIWPPLDYPQTNSFGQAYHLAYGQRWKPPKYPIALYETKAYPDLPRPSYATCIEWGRKKLRIHSMSGTELSIKDYHVERLHRHVAGRATRSQKTWDLMWEEIARGRGELIDTFFEGNHIGSTVMIDGDDCSIYWTGAYDREFFIHGPISHLPLWIAIGNAGLRHRFWVELGEMPTQPLTTEASIQRTKEYNIGFFKRGFATHTADNGVITPYSIRKSLLRPPIGDTRLALFNADDIIAPWTDPRS